nr:retrovirus-related Pol polyprotein from transposon TNT 1-94 [Tanacetum cinerariifolium]
MVCFGNNDFAVIAGYGDVVIGSMTINKVYYVEGLGHNLFSVGQFCDKGLEVAFRKSTCFVQNEDGVDLLTGLPKMKFEKDHLCSACEQGKIHRKHHKSKTAFASNKPLYLLYMDLCGPMCIQSINEKRYVVVVVDDYSLDIMFATCMCARYQPNPNERHVSAVKRIFCYLKGTIHLGLWYPKDSGFDLTAYSDADHAGCHLDRKSTSGSVQFLGDKLVCWSSKKQNCVSISTTESEYVAVSGCCAQVFWMHTQLTDYGFFYDKVPIYYDSKSAIAISCIPVQHTRIKHIDVRYHFIKDHVEKGTIELSFVGTEYQLADLFMKSLFEARFKFLVEKLGMMSRET